MKTICFLQGTLVLLFATFHGTAQTNSEKSGLYSSADDFSKHALTYAFDCRTSMDRLHLNELLGSSKGYVLYNGEKHVFYKDKIYGYRDCRNKDYRFYHNAAYQILDTAAFFVYYQYRSEQPAKGKEPVKTDEYYFSTTANGALQLLTIDNLKKAFPQNNKFHYALDEQFRSDKELIAYDRFLKTYKVKYVYSQSVK